MARPLKPPIPVLLPALVAALGCDQGTYVVGETTPADADVVAPTPRGAGDAAGPAPDPGRADAAITSGGGRDGAAGSTGRDASPPPPADARVAAPDLLAVRTDGSTSTPPAACAFRAGPMPIRPLAIPPRVAAERLERFLDPMGMVPGTIEPGEWRTTADIERAVRAYYGDTSTRQHALAHAAPHVLPFVAWWLGAGAQGFLDAFVAGPGGLRQLRTYPSGPPAERRVGILSETEVLARFGSPSRRGLVVRTKLLCQQVPPPPPNTPVDPLPARPGLTGRQRLEQATADPACAACHRLIDPPGFAFEHYDRVGRYRATDNGLPIDPSGAIIELDGRSVSFDGPARLMDAIAGSCAVRECMARSWLEFALSRFGRVLAPSDSTQVREGIREVAGAFVASREDLRELVIAVTLSQPFLAP